MSEFNDNDLRRLLTKLDELTSVLGRGHTAGQTGGTRPHSNGGSQTAAKADKGADKLLRDRMKAYADAIAEGKDISDSARKELKEFEKQQKKINKLQEDTEDKQKLLIGRIDNFSRSILSGSASVSGAMTSLSYSLSNGNSVMSKALSGMAAGFGFTLGVLENFAASARDMGAFADLSAFSIGSIKQAKLMSGLGDSFIKVISDSNGGFKAFGSSSQKATENLSDLARGLRLGSYSINGSLQKALGPEYVKKMNKAAQATAAMGLSQEDQASLMGTLSSTIALTAKNETDAQQKLVKQYEETVDSARTLSNTFGTSAKEILKSIENFKKSTSGQAAELQGVAGAQDIKQALSAAGVSASEEDLNRMALLMAKGQTGAASTYVNPEAMANFQGVAAGVESARTKAGGLGNTQNLAQGMQEQRGTFEQIGQQRGDLGAKGTEGLFDAGVAAATLAKKLDLQAKAAAGDEAAKKELASGIGTTTESGNIQAMDQLTGALNSLRNVVLSLMAGIVGLTGVTAALVLSGGIGAIAGGGTGIISKLGDLVGSGLSKAGSMIPGKWNPFTANQGPQLPGKAGSGVMDKLSGTVGKGMEGFGEMLGKLGESKTVKGAATLTLLGGALALAAHGFNEFGQVKWEGMLKGTVALGGLVLMARGIGEASTGMVKGAASIALLGAAMWLAGKGFSTFNDLNWEGIAKGAVALGVFGLAASVLGTFLPAILLGSVAIAALGVAVGVAGIAMIPAAYAFGLFADSMQKIGAIDGANLIAVGAGLAAVGAGAIAFALGMAVATAGSMVSSIMSLFGAKSPLDQIMKFVPYADAISAVGQGIKAFGEGVLTVATGVSSIEADSLGKLRDQLVEFAKAGSSDELRITAENLTQIGTALSQISQVGEIKLPNLNDVNVSGTMSPGSTLSPGESIVGDNKAPAMTPELIQQMMSYLSSIQNDLAAIRTNTKGEGSFAPVRLG
jgi:hypothetical protein